jgi:hypothetical protein
LAGAEVDLSSNSESKVPVLQTATAIAISFMICKIGAYLTQLCKIQGGTLPAVTAIVVFLATLFPAQFGYLAPTGDTLAMVLMQVKNVVSIVVSFKSLPLNIFVVSVLKLLHLLIPGS